MIGIMRVGMDRHGVTRGMIAAIIPNLAQPFDIHDVVDYAKRVMGEDLMSGNVSHSLVKASERGWLAVARPGGRSKAALYVALEMPKPEERRKDDEVEAPPMGEVEIAWRAFCDENDVGNARSRIVFD